MKECEGVKFKKTGDKIYLIVWPSGLKSTIDAENDSEVKIKIKEIKDGLSKKV